MWDMIMEEEHHILTGGSWNEVIYETVYHPIELPLSRRQLKIVLEGCGYYFDFDLISHTRNWNKGIFYIQSKKFMRNFKITFTREKEEEVHNWMVEGF